MPDAIEPFDPAYLRLIDDKPRATSVETLRNRTGRYLRPLTTDPRSLGHITIGLREIDNLFQM
jgi:hypothetical protein